VANKTDLVVLGFDLATERLLTETDEALRKAEAFGDAYGLSLARLAHGTALLRSGRPDRDDGIDLLQLSRSGGIDIGGSMTDATLATATARHDQGYEQIDTLRAVIQPELDRGETLFTGYSTSVLVKLLVNRGTPNDLTQAHAFVAQLEEQIAAVASPALALWPLQCRTRLAKVVGDEASYGQFVTRYRNLSEELDARGHIDTAKRLAGAPGVRLRSAHMPKMHPS
jgi:adenylate cyclase